MFKTHPSMHADYQSLEKTGRISGTELYFVNKDTILAPTLEEEVTGLIGSHLTSYKQLPIRVYQIGKKFRNEKRPRGGLLRGREFIMKDLYTFDKNQEDAAATFSEICDAYREIFERIGIEFHVAEASTGDIGGIMSSEFHYKSEGLLLFKSAGEDVVGKCSGCGHTANVEISTSTSCRKCGDKVETFKSIEVGHAFNLATTYTKPLGVAFKDASQTLQLAQMCCFGIGVSRLLAAVVDVAWKGNRMEWPVLIAPFTAIVLPIHRDDDALKIICEALDGVDYAIDDRDYGAGWKMNDAAFNGYPFVIVLGKKSLDAGCVEVVVKGEKVQVLQTNFGEWVKENIKNLLKEW